MRNKMVLHDAIGDSIAWTGIIIMVRIHVDYVDEDYNIPCKTTNIKSEAVDVDVRVPANITFSTNKVPY